MFWPYVGKNKKKPIDIIVVFSTRKTHKFRVLHVKFERDIFLFISSNVFNKKLLFRRQHNIMEV